VAGGGGGRFVVDEVKGDKIGFCILFDERKGELVGHLHNEKAGGGSVHWLAQDLAARKRVVFAAVVFDVTHSGWLDAPEMVDKKFGIDAEELIKEIFVFNSNASKCAKSS